MALDQPEADASLKDDVHYLIVDYMVYNTVSGLLLLHNNRLDPQFNPADSEAIRAAETMKNHVRMVDTFIKVHKASSPAESASPTAHFRLRLARFLIMYTMMFQRSPLAPLIPGYVASLRLRNQERAQKWRDTIGDGAFDEKLLGAIENCAGENTVDSERGDGGGLAGDKEGSHVSHKSNTQEQFQLLDLLPAFVELTALRAQLGRMDHVPRSAKDQSISNAEPTGKRKRTSPLDNPASSPRSTSASFDLDDFLSSARPNHVPVEEPASESSWATTRRWLELCLSMMQHAALESNAKRSPRQQLVDAFSWGPGPWDAQDVNYSHHGRPTPLGGCNVSNFEDDDVRLHNIFQLETDLPKVDNGVPGKTAFGNLEYARTYRTMRQELLSELLACLGTSDDTLARFNRMLKEHPKAKLDREMIEYLQILHHSIEVPVLVQLERHTGEEDDEPFVVDGVELSRDEASTLHRLFREPFYD